MKSRLLRNTLITNATFSLLCGITMSVFHTDMAALMGNLPPWVYLGLGVGLILFAADVYLVALRHSINPTFARLICWADMLWVAGSLGLLLFASTLFTTDGLFLITSVGIVVAVFAFLQRQGLKQAEPAQTAAA